MMDLDELERITKAGDHYGHITPGRVLDLIAEVRRLLADLDGAVEMANANATDAARWQHVYHGPYVICRVHADGKLESLGGSYVGKYAIEDDMSKRRHCPTCGVKDIPVGSYCKGRGCPLNPATKDPA